jgi:hypothetical protein
MFGKTPGFRIAFRIVFLVAALLIALYLKYNFSASGIYRNVINQNGYQVFEIQKPIHFSTFIKPSWIPTKENEVLKVNEDIAEVSNVNIVLESVIYRENDIYFNFDAKQLIEHSKGEILANYVLNPDGTCTTYTPRNGFHIYNKNNEIDVGQTGFGPDSKFSFGIDLENYNSIKDGFTFVYNGSILYGYSKINWQHF